MYKLHIKYLESIRTVRPIKFIFNCMIQINRRKRLIENYKNNKMSLLTYVYFLIRTIKCIPIIFIYI